MGDTSAVRSEILRHVHRIVAAGITVVLIASLMTALYTTGLSRKTASTNLQAIAARLSETVDLEVERTRALLVGLSGAPALRTGDFEAFHAQMVRTPVPEGTLIVLSDRRRQLVNSLRPFGDELPDLSQYKPQAGFFEGLSRDGYYVSGIVFGPVLGKAATTVSIAVLGPGGRPGYLLTSAISRDRLMRLIAGQAIPEEVSVVLLDRDGSEIAVAGTERLVGNLRPADGSQQGLLHETDAAGGRREVAYAVSSLTGWKTVIISPSRNLHSAFFATAALIAPLLLLFGVTAGIGFLILRRQIEDPLEQAEASLARSREEALELVKRLATVRDDEQRRIGQDLHDTTAKHLVAASLYLSALRKGGSGARTGRQIEEIETLVETSLRELRSFSFLLKPGIAEGTRLDTAVRDLATGYAKRAGLRATIEIDDDVALLAPPIGDVVFRGAQEGLANIVAHAGATTFRLSISSQRSRIVLTLEDDGRGGIDYSTDETVGPPRGLGLSGMAERVVAVEGSLILHDTGKGMRLVMTIPVPAVGRKVAVPRL